MAIAFRAVASATGATTDTVTIAKPTGTVDGDVMIAMLYAETGGQDCTPPAGWTVITPRIDSTNFSMHTFWKRASGEGASYNFTETGNAWGEGFIASYSGCLDSGNPIDATGTGNSGNSGTATASAIVTTSDGAMLLYMANEFSVVTHTPPGGMSERLDLNGRTLADVIQTTANSSGSQAATLSGSAEWLCVLVALKPSLSLTVQSTTCTASSDATAGTVAWTSPTNANTSNSVRATAALTAVNTNSRYLKGVGFGFAIPASAVIVGIQVEVNVLIGAGTTATDTEMKLVKAGTIGATDRSSSVVYTTAATNIMHGSPTDLWGDTWTPTDINDANFGCALRSLRTGGSPTVSVDNFRVTISYLPQNTPELYGRPDGISGQRQMHQLLAA